MQPADYGLDAPHVVRNLFIVSVLGLALWLTSLLRFWTGWLVIPLGGVRIMLPLASQGFLAGIACAFTGTWMVWSSKVGKIRERERLLQEIAWTGNERVLDVGCGRGLMLIGAAKRLTTGAAVGVDIWQVEDLSGNKPEATTVNAEREGVSDRVEIRTADMRTLPFPDATFDVIVSRAAIHNIYSADDRAKAIREIARVLKPGGNALINDIRHLAEYQATFSQNHCAEVRWIGSRLTRLFAALISFGALRPATILVRKNKS